MNLQSIITDIENKLSIRIQNSSEIHGGDINRCFKIQSNTGSFFLKTNNITYEDMFRKEFNGLATLYETHTIKLPQPLAHGTHGDQQWLVMEFLDRSGPKPDFWIKFGESLASLHKHSHPLFGFHENNFIGSLPQLNELSASWSSFYAQQRLMPLIKKAFDEKKCIAADVKAADQLCDKLPNIFHDEPPSLLHGDLWSGNFLCTAGGYAAIFDPAVYYGNREMDLAMSLLFGGFNHEFYENYNEAYPLEKNWKQRVELCQLYPLLVHLLLFGGSYYPRVKEILRKY